MKFLCWIYLDLLDVYTNDWRFPSCFAGLLTLAKQKLNNLLLLQISILPKTSAQKDKKASSNCNSEFFT